MCIELWKEKVAVIYFMFQRILILNMQRRAFPKIYHDIFGKLRQNVLLIGSDT